MTFILRKTGLNTWCIYSPKGHAVTDPKKCTGKMDAIQWATNWVSSFSGAILKVEDE